WDVLYPPHKLRVPAALYYPSTPIISWTEFALPAAQAALPDGGHPLCLLVLIFPHLSIKLEITPSAGGSPAGDRRYVSVWDVLLGLYNGLRTPITPAALADMASADQRGLARSATRRMELLPSDRGSSSIRKVDFLGRRRRFLGIRSAQPGEVPLGKGLGEVFVVD
ncbi:hypothetical protein BD413DRAFT_453081, partial [Trametes elegans]